VDFWITINEPESFAQSYLWGNWPPQRKNVYLTLKVLNNLITAHNQSSAIIRKTSNKPIGMAYNLVDFTPVSFWSSILTTQIFRFINFYVMRRTIKTCDFVGVNYYFHFKVGLLGRIVAKAARKSDTGFQIYPKGFENVLLYLKRYNKPIYITENGVADSSDTQRQKFIHDHIFFMHKAISKGVDIRGYLHWSLIDNFEWAEGFTLKFGLISVDRNNGLRRTVKQSARAYAEICRDNHLFS
jgi:beta-glucosidase